MTTADADDNNAAARSVIERAVWAWGVEGDSCALLTERILRSLAEAGLRVLPTNDK